MNAQRTLSLLLATLASCSHRPAPTEAATEEAGVRVVPDAAFERVPAQTASAELVDVDEDEEILVVEELPDGSYILRAPSVIRAAPDRESVALGVLAVGTRLPRHEPIDAPGCKGGWVPVEPRGFACVALDLVEDEPRALVQPVMRGAATLPTVYGRVRRTAKVYADADAVRAGVSAPPAVSLTVERRGSVKIAGETYWRTRHGLISGREVRRLRGSRFEGVALGEDVSLPVAWTLPGERRSVRVHSKPSKRARPAGRLPAHTALTDPNLTADPDFLEVAGKGWVARKDVRVALATQPPADLQPEELWLDVNLQEQTLVAYRGENPVYATLVSTGKARYETPVGEFRIERKVSMRTMNSRQGAKETYAVDKVPWTAYFKDSYALHTAYWHSGFGRVRSHGCINLAPADAQRIYGWMGPHAAPGWREVYATDEQPGTRVVIREG